MTLFCRKCEKTIIYPSSVTPADISTLACQHCGRQMVLFQAPDIEQPDVKQQIDDMQAYIDDADSDCEGCGACQEAEDAIVYGKPMDTEETKADVVAFTLEDWQREHDRLLSEADIHSAVLEIIDLEVEDGWPTPSAKDIDEMRDRFVAMFGDGK